MEIELISLFTCWEIKPLFLFVPWPHNREGRVNFIIHHLEHGLYWPNNDLTNNELPKGEAALI